jgi:mRNA deadenylase 3'-5' endonuclease subunit Ccr4
MLLRYSQEEIKQNEKRKEYIKNNIFQKFSRLPSVESVYRSYTHLVDSSPPAPWTGEPPYTNITSEWKGTLDYVSLLFLYHYKFDL